MRRIDPYSSRSALLHHVAAALFVSVTLLLAGGPSAALAQSAMSHSASFQSQDIRSLDPWNLEVVEQRVGDLNPLGKSLRMLEAGLADPNDFRQVFRVPGEGDLLMRVQGGIYAVFPQSVYKTFQTRRESFILPVVPNNTVFYIGRHSLEYALSGWYGSGLLPSAADVEPMHRIAALPASLPIDTALHMRVHDAIESEPAPGSDSLRVAGAQKRDRSSSERAAADEARANRALQMPALVADADYRRGRIGELMRRAAAADPSTDS